MSSIKHIIGFLPPRVENVVFLRRRFVRSLSRICYVVCSSGLLQHPGIISQNFSNKHQTNLSSAALSQWLHLLSAWLWSDGNKSPKLNCCGKTLAVRSLELIFLCILGSWSGGLNIEQNTQALFTFCGFCLNTNTNTDS